MEETAQQNEIKIGVTITEADVFETDDLPEDDQQLVSDYFSNSHAKDNHKSEFIDASRIDATESFKAFEGKSLDSDRVDFSDSIATQRVGYPMTEASTGRNETLMEEYLRLEKAIENLAQEINILKDAGDSDQGDRATLATTSLMQRLTFLQKELSSVGSKEEVVDNDPQNFYHRKLLNDLDLFITSSSSGPASSSLSSSSSSSSAPSGDVVKYQMFCTPGETLHADDTVIDDIEQRIQRCENIIGLGSDKTGLLTGESQSKTIMGALSLVVAKFALLDLTQLTHFESSLLAIQQKQIQASTKSEASDIADKVDKVSHVYEVVKRSNPTMEKLYDISDRLKARMEADQSAAQFSGALARVDSSQKQLIDRLQSHTEHLKQVQALLGPQMSQFEANCEALKN